MEKEARCILRLKHPNVVCHFGTELLRSIIVAEYLEKVKVEEQAYVIHNVSLDTASS